MEQVLEGHAAKFYKQKNEKLPSERATSNAIYRNVILDIFEVITKYYPNFITCLYFSLALISWNSSHCQVMELFKSKESFKEKADLNNNWKTVWARMILELHLILSLGFVRKILSFVGKHLSFNQRCLFSFFISLFKWRGVNPASTSDKICRKWSF